MELSENLDVNGQKIEGDILVFDSEGDVITDLGDSQGVNKVSIRDSNGVEKFSIDSSGNVSFTGTLNGEDFQALVASLSNLETPEVTSAIINAAGGLLKSHVSGNLTTLSLPEDVTISSFAKSLLSLESGSAFRSAIEAELKGSLLVPDASQSEKGRIELATQSEVDTGTDNTKAVTPNTLANWSGNTGGEGGSPAYVHPDHTGDVSSSGSGATTITPQAFSSKQIGSPASTDLVLYQDSSGTEPEVKSAALSSLVASGVPTATTATAGKVELATQAEVDLGTDANRAITPATLSQYVKFDELGGGDDVGDASTTQKGIIEIATQAEVDAGSDATRAVTPATLPDFSNLSTSDRRVERIQLFAPGVSVSYEFFDLLRAPRSGTLKYAFIHTWNRQNTTGIVEVTFKVNGGNEFVLSDTSFNGQCSYEKADLNIAVAIGQLIEVEVDTPASDLSDVPDGLEVYLEWE